MPTVDIYNLKKKKVGLQSAAFWCAWASRSEERGHVKNAAELYKKHGLRGAFFATARSGQTDIELQLYDMGSAPNAVSVLEARDRPKDAVALALADGAYRFEGGAELLLGRVYGRLIVTGRGDMTAPLQELLTALGRQPVGLGTAAERVLTLGIGGRVAEGIDVARAALEHAPDSAALHAAISWLGEARKGWKTCASGRRSAPGFAGSPIFARAIRAPVTRSLSLSSSSTTTRDGTSSSRTRSSEGRSWSRTRSAGSWPRK